MPETWPGQKARLEELAADEVLGSDDRAAIRAALARLESHAEDGDLHEMRCLLYEDGWDSVGSPQDRLRVVLQRWQETRKGNIRATAELKSLRESHAELVEALKQFQSQWGCFGGCMAGMAKPGECGQHDYSCSVARVALAHAAPSVGGVK